MADFHAADLWVAVVPETSQVGPAMEAAGKEAKGKFGAAVKDFGKTIHDDLDKIGEKAKDSFSHAGEHAKDAFSKAGKMAGDAFNSELGKELQAAVGDEIGKAVSGAVKELPLFKTATEYVGAFTRATDAASESLGSVRDTLTSIKSHDVDGALSGVESSLRGMEPIAKQFGTDISDWHVPAPLTDGLKKADETSHDLVKNFADAKGGIDRLGQSGGGLSGLIGKLGELGTIAAAVVATLDSIKSADHWLEDKMPWYRNLDEQFKNNPLNKFFGGGTSPSGPTATTDANGQTLFRSGATAGSPMPDSPTDEWDPTWGPRPTGGGLGWFGRGGPRPSLPTPPMGLPPIPQTPMPAMPTMPSPGLESGGGTAGGGGGGGGIAGSGLSSRILGGANSRQGLRAAGGQVANLLAFAESLAGTPYSKELRNDCSGMVAKLANVALGLPPAASFSTVNEGQWLMSHGFEPGLGGPNDLNIGWYDHGGGDAGHTAATLPGGIHAESGGSHGNFLLGSGAAGADNPEFSQHAHLSMGSLRGGGAAGQMPTGAEHDPLYVTQSSGGAGGGTGGSNTFQSQGQQLGQGLMNGVLQMFGIDGSVFGGKSPLDWGAVKLGGGLLNYGMGLMNSMSGGPMGSPGMGGGGGGGLLSGLTGLIPHPGPGISAAVGPGGGSLGIGQQSGAGQTTINHDQSININNPSGDPYGWLLESQWGKNAQRDAPRSNAYLSQPAT